MPLRRLLRPVQSIDFRCNYNRYNGYNRYNRYDLKDDSQTDITHIYNAGFDMNTGWGLVAVVGGGGSAERGPGAHTFKMVTMKTLQSWSSLAIRADKYCSIWSDDVSSIIRATIERVCIYCKGRGRDGTLDRLGSRDLGYELGNL